MRTAKYYLPFILSAIILLLLNSCTTTKHIDKTDTKETVNSDTQITMTRTVSEVADTSITTPVTIQTVEADIQRLLDGDTITQDLPTETITNKVVKGKLKTTVLDKPQKIPFKVNKVAIEQFKGDQKVKTNLEVESKVKDVKRVWHTAYLWWLLLLLIIPIWKYRNKLFN